MPLPQLGSLSKPPLTRRFGDGLVTSVNACVAVLLFASVTCTMKSNVPLLVGVPEITPLVARLNPGGNAPEMLVQLYGVCPPDAVNVWLYDVPFVPFGKEVVSTTSGTLTILDNMVGQPSNNVPQPVVPGR